jgi:hypothetical protein
MSHIRFSSVRRLTDALWLNDRGEKLQMVDGLLVSSLHTLSATESQLAEILLKNWREQSSKKA